MTGKISEKTIENACGGQFVYISYKKGGAAAAAIKRYRGTAEKIIVPDEIEGLPVAAVGRKAFLSCKTVHFITLPETIEEIGDWAFAHAERLRSICIPRRPLSCGKELFLGCKELKEIALVGKRQGEFEEYKQNGLYRMLAIAVRVFRDYFLLDPAGFGNDAWMRRWDEKLISLMELDDLDGFEELWTCGEEDYEGKDYDIRSYPVEKRRMKLRIVYFRLLHPYRLSDSVYERLAEYLRRYTKGMETQEAWDIILEEHREDLAYYKLFAETGCVTADNFDSLLLDMDQVGAEIKAYLLRYKEGHFAPADMFSAFALDW